MIKNEETAKRKYATIKQLNLCSESWRAPENLPLDLTTDQQIIPPVEDEFKERCDTLAKNDVESQPNQHKLPHPTDQFDSIPNPKSTFIHPDPPPSETQLSHGPPVDAEPFRRMKATIDWIRCRAYDLMTDINDAVISPAKYPKARDAYNEFLDNLQTHAFNTQPFTMAQAKKGIGLGANLSWLLVCAIVRNEPAKDNQNYNFITGLRVVGEWNPHYSSNGVPIPHS
jgi:hypothetical protein